MNGVLSFVLMELDCPLVLQIQVLASMNLSSLADGISANMEAGCAISLLMSSASSDW